MINEHGKEFYQSPLLALPESSVGGWSVTRIMREPGYCFHTTTIRSALIGGQEDRTVLFDTPTTWHELREGTSLWMSDYPIEQKQHDDAISRIKTGPVLIGGLGLGYAVTALMLRRPRLKAIIVVEKSQDVIDLIWPHIEERRKLLGRRTHLEVLHNDLFGFLRIPAVKETYAAAFFDIWAGDGEATFHETVMPLRKLARQVVPSGNIQCWNEDVMRGQLANRLIGQASMLHLNGDYEGQLACLIEPRGRVYDDWAVDFWRGIAQSTARLTFEAITARALVYAQSYGR